MICWSRHCMYYFLKPFQIISFKLVHFEKNTIVSQEKNWLHYLPISSLLLWNENTPKEEDDSFSSLLPNKRQHCLMFQFLSNIAGAAGGSRLLPGEMLGSPQGTPWTVCHSANIETITSHTYDTTLSTPPVWTVGASWCTWGKPIQTREKHLNSTQKVPKPAGFHTGTLPTNDRLC